MKLHHKILGEGEPLIILHGLFSTLDNWQSLAKKYAEHFKVILVDQRNHGHSPHSDEMSYELMVEDLFELMNDLRIEKTNIIGHSMGGKTAMFFAQQYPGLVEKLVVADMGLKKYPPHHDEIFESMLTMDFNVITTRKKAEEHIRTFFTDNGVIQFLLKNLYWGDDQKLAWRMNLHVLNKKIENILAGVPQKKCEVETLFVRGSKSNYIEDADWKEIKTLFPRSTLSTLNTGHWVHAEDPQGFYDITKEFLLS
ncbi:MAG: alpha/beta fold hydrolase [Flavobacteriales bacterium]